MRTRLVVLEKFKSKLRKISLTYDSRSFFQEIVQYFKGGGLRAKALRGSVFMVMEYVFSMNIRLASNLILTRLLFPEIFGLMAIVQVFMQGLVMFSDLGIRISIIQHKQGGDPKYFNTVWTIQVIRGIILFSITWAIAWPLSIFYDIPILAKLLPITGITALIAGFYPTKLALANKNLTLEIGRAHV